MTGKEFLVGEGLNEADHVEVPPQTGLALGEPAIEVAPGVLAETVRRFLRNRLSVAGLVIVIVLLAAAILADILSPYPRDFAVFSQVLKPPSPQHLLGTDSVGRDFFTRILHAARTSMLVGLTVPVLSAVVGIPLGAFAAWRGGRVDALFLRVVEIFTAVPPYMLVILLVSVWGSGVDKIILFLGATGWVGLARLARAQVVGIRPQEFVTSAHALGASDLRILSQHILPNAAGAMVVVLVMSVPSAIFAEAGLSVLGLGVKDPVPSWGKMVAEGMPYAQAQPLLALIPIGLIAVTMLAFSFVGDGLRDAFDPHSRL